MFDKWGFKAQCVSRFDPKKVHDALVNPYYIVISRCPIAVAQRRLNGVENIDADLFMIVLKQVMDEYAALWEWVLTLPPSPVLGVSYERCTKNREAFVASVERFLGVSANHEQHAKAINRISTTGGYLMYE